MVDGLVEAGPGVDLAAVGLDVLGNLARARGVRGALEEHVLVQVRQPELVPPFRPREPVFTQTWMATTGDVDYGA